MKTKTTINKTALYHPLTVFLLSLTLTLWIALIIIRLDADTITVLFRLGVITIVIAAIYRNVIA